MGEEGKRGKKRQKKKQNQKDVKLKERTLMIFSKDMREKIKQDIILL
jgi:ribosomal protein S25